MNPCIEWPELTQLNFKFSFKILSGISLMFLLLGKPTLVNSQRIFVNDYWGSMVEYKWNGTTLNMVDSFSIKYLGERLQVFSSCILKDTLYFTAAYKPGIGRYILGSNAEPVFFASGQFLSGANSMAISNDGIIYMADYNPFVSDSRKLYKFDTRSNSFSQLPNLNYAPSGDLMFYKDKLLLACHGDIVEVNLSNPYLSTSYIRTPNLFFYGLISLPKNCSENRHFGIQAFSYQPLIELDLENRRIIGDGPFVNVDVYDGASAVDNGNTQGARIDSLQYKGLCPNDTGGVHLKVFASTASNGSIRYELGNFQNNTSGQFSNIPNGKYQLRIITANGCVTDSLITIEPVQISLDAKTSPATSCSNPDGRIFIQSNGNYSPFQYRINNNPYTLNNNFENLTSGIYSVQMKNSAGCTLSDTFTISNLAWNGKIIGISTTASVCSANNGTAIINLNAPSDSITVALNDAIPSRNFQFQSLAAGVYKLSFFFNNGCRFDTLFTIAQQMPQRPDWQLNATNQQCFNLENGSIEISLAGDRTGYSVSLNGSTPSTQWLFSDLSPGKFLATLIDKNGCSWSDSATILAYSKPISKVTWQTVSPNCDDHKGGSIQLKIEGGYPPYQVLDSTGNPISATQPITQLKEGSYIFRIINADVCPEQEIRVPLPFENTGNCDFFYVPNAFTPNGDGINDRLKPIYSPLFKNIRFTIYNRYGQVVYEYSTNAPGWNGQIRGALQPSGTYVWAATYIDQKGKQQLLKGQFVLIR